MSATVKAQSAKARLANVKGSRASQKGVAAPLQRAVGFEVRRAIGQCASVSGPAQTVQPGLFAPRLFASRCEPPGVGLADGEAQAGGGRLAV